MVVSRGLAPAAAAATAALALVLGAAPSQVCMCVLWQVLIDYSGRRFAAEGTQFHPPTNPPTQAFVNPLSSSPSGLARRGPAPAPSQPASAAAGAEASGRLRPLRSTMSPSDTATAAATGGSADDGWDFVGAPWPDEVDYEDLADKVGVGGVGVGLGCGRNGAAVLTFLPSVHPHHHHHDATITGRGGPEGGGAPALAAGRDEAGVPRGEEPAGLLDALRGTWVNCAGAFGYTCACGCRGE